MSKKTYIGVNNVAKNVPKCYWGVNNVAKKVVKLYYGVNNLAKLIFQSEDFISLTISTAGTYALNIYKEDTQATNVYIDNVLVSTSTQQGSQDISITTTSENSVVKIKSKGNWCFDNYCLGSLSNNSKIVNANLSNTSLMTSIGSKSFRNCNITSVEIPNSVTSVDYLAFCGCSRLALLIIQHGVIIIGQNSFDSCIGLTSVVIPDSVTRIDNGAFWGCSNITSIVIGNGILNIFGGAFSVNGSLEKTTKFILKLKSRTPCTLAKGAMYADNISKIQIPRGSLSAYQNATNWATFASYFEEY